MRGRHGAGCVLILSSDVEGTGALASELAADGHEVLVTAAADVAGQRGHAVVATVVLDLDAARRSDLLAAAREAHPAARLVVVSRTRTLAGVVEALRQGAADCLFHPLSPGELARAVRRGLPTRPRTAPRRFGSPFFLTRARVMQPVFEELEAVAGSRTTVLLLGDSGVGKEAVARALHAESPRRAAPFVAIACGGFPESLLESELFGHEKGAFTSADRARRGLISEAHGGTLFLDEVGDLPPPLQVKLLRVLQERRVRPVGSDDEGVPVDLRIVGATSRDLARCVQEKSFREDLYYRLAVVPIRIPSLRERPEDIVFLAEHFRERAVARSGKAVEGFDPDALAWLRQHRWPGNVRELENVVERAVTLAQGSRIGRQDLMPELALGPVSRLPIRPTLAEVEDAYVRRVLSQTADRRAAARVLGVSVRTLQRRARAGRLV